MIGPDRTIGRLPIGWGTHEIKLGKGPPAYYRFEPVTGAVSIR
jgi:hypothetical protein